MRAWLRSWFFPAYPDEDLNRRARLLNVMTTIALLLALLVNVALVVSTIPLGQLGSTVIAAVTIVVCLVWIGTIVLLSRLGHIAAGSHVLLWGGIVITTLSNVTDPNSGLTDPGWYLLLITVVAASLLLGTGSLAAAWSGLSSSPSSGLPSWPRPKLTWRGRRPTWRRRWSGRSPSTPPLRSVSPRAT
jgi:hypothetical protein